MSEPAERAATPAAGEGTTPVDQALRDLTGTVDRIGASAEAVNRIANQTNRLAIDAIIEAANAGDAGQGFTTAAAAQEAISTHTTIYLNRLSDLLFVLARWVNHQAGIDEAQWQPGKEG